MHTVEIPIHYFDTSGILQDSSVCVVDQVEAAVQEWYISQNEQYSFEELILERLEECILGTEGLEFVKYLTTEPYIQNPSIHTATSAVFHMSSEKFAQWESGGLELTKLTSADIEQIRTCYRNGLNDLF